MCLHLTCGALSFPLLLQGSCQGQCYLIPLFYSRWVITSVGSLGKTVISEPHCDFFVPTAVADGRQKEMKRKKNTATSDGCLTSFCLAASSNSRSCVECHLDEDSEADLCDEKCSIPKIFINQTSGKGPPVLTDQCRAVQTFITLMCMSSVWYYFYRPSVLNLAWFFWSFIFQFNSLLEVYKSHLFLHKNIHKAIVWFLVSYHFAEPYFKETTWQWTKYETHCQVNFLYYQASWNNLHSEASRQGCK